MLGKTLFNYCLQKIIIHLKIIISLNLILFFTAKSEFKFENCFFVVPYSKIVLNCHYLSNELTIEMDVLHTSKKETNITKHRKMQRFGGQKNVAI